MAIKAFDVSIQSIIEKKRFEPRFYRVFNQFQKIEESWRHTILDLWNKQILKKITDWEHAWQIFVKKWVRFLKNSSVRDFSINLLDDFFITEEKHIKQKRSSLKSLDILFTTIWHLWSTCIVPENFWEANINQNMVKMEVDNEFINPFYLTAYLNSNATKKQIWSLFTWNIHSILTYPKIKSIKIIIPNKEFEEEIGKKYKISIEKEQEAMKLINQAQELFYKNIWINFSEIENPKVFEVNMSYFKNNDLWTPKFSYPLYINTLELIKTKWETITLWEIATIKKWDEVWSENYIEYLDKRDTDIPFIRTSDLVNYELDPSPDNFVDETIYNELWQDNQEWDILFTKDWKIWMTAFITRNDKCILASWLTKLRLKQIAKKYNITPEYLFTVLETKEIWKYQADMMTVIASTIPHLKEDRIESFMIPILDKEIIIKITELVKKAFILKDEKKVLIREIKKEIDNSFDF